MSKYRITTQSLGNRERIELQGQKLDSEMRREKRKSLGEIFEFVWKMPFSKNTITHLIVADSISKARSLSKIKLAEKYLSDAKFAELVAEKQTDELVRR